LQEASTASVGKARIMGLMSTATFAASAPLASGPAPIQTTQPTAEGPSANAARISACDVVLTAEAMQQWRLQEVPMSEMSGWYEFQDVMGNQTAFQESGLSDEIVDAVLRDRGRG
jgi:hypothetical protein